MLRAIFKADWDITRAPLAWARREALDAKLPPEARTFWHVEHAENIARKMT